MNKCKYEKQIFGISHTKEEQSKKKLLQRLYVIESNRHFLAVARGFTEARVRYLASKPSLGHHMTAYA